MSGGGCHAAGAGDIDVQVGGALHRERRRGAGEFERVSKRNCYGWVGGRKEGVKNDLDNEIIKRWGGELY